MYFLQCGWPEMGIRLNFLKILRLNFLFLFNKRNILLLKIVDAHKQTFLRISTIWYLIYVEKTVPTKYLQCFWQIIVFSRQQEILSKSLSIKEVINFIFLLLSWQFYVVKIFIRNKFIILQEGYYLVVEIPRDKWNDYNYSFWLLQT